MKVLMQTWAVILLSTISVHGQPRVQNIGAFPDTAKAAKQAPTKIIAEPKVLGIGKTWAVISWTTNARGRGHSRIYAGTDPKNLKLAEETPAKNPKKDDRLPSYAKQEYAHLVRLNNLKPGTTYYFKADSGSKTDQGVESKSHTSRFTTMAHGSVS